jgi:hypothetical protein
MNVSAMDPQHEKLNLGYVEKPSSSRHSSQKQTQTLYSSAKTVREAVVLGVGPEATWYYLEIQIARSLVGMIHSSQGLTSIKMMDPLRRQKTCRIFHP